MSFHIGQKVVWVGVKGGTIFAPPEFSLKRNTVYTIRDIDTRALRHHSVATIRLEEMIRPTRFYNDIGMMWEVGYHPGGFHPIIERKTDISIFTAMLDPTRHKELINYSVNLTGDE